MHFYQRSQNTNLKMNYNGKGINVARDAQLLGIKINK